MAGRPPIGRMARLVLPLDVMSQQNESAAQIARTWVASDANRRDGTEEPAGPDGPVWPAATGGPDGTDGTLPFWDEPGGLRVVSARLLPSRCALEFRLRGGQSYALELEALGFAGPGLLAAPATGGRGIVLALGPTRFVDVASSLLLSACEPAYREARLRAAAGPERIGARIRARRLAAGRKASEVAEAAGMAPSHYSRLEASRHRPRFDTLERVAAALGVRVHDLLAGAR